VEKQSGKRPEYVKFLLVKVYTKPLLSCIIIFLEIIVIFAGIKITRKNKGGVT